MTSCHHIPTWHEWNVNAGDVKGTQFASYVNLVTSHWACMLHACMHVTCALSKWVHLITEKYIAWYLVVVV